MAYRHKPRAIFGMWSVGASDLRSEQYNFWAVGYTPPVKDWKKTLKKL